MGARNGSLLLLNTDDNALDVEQPSRKPLPCVRPLVWISSVAFLAVVGFTFGACAYVLRWRTAAGASDIQKVALIPSAVELEGRPSDPKFINALQFSPHAECFIQKFDDNYPHCWHMVQNVTTQLLLQQDPGRFEHPMDFANIVYSNNRYVPPAGWRKIHTQCPSPPAASSGDDTMLVYNTERWKEIGVPHRGCLSYDQKRRPFIVQAFGDRIHGGHPVIVLSAHFPHMGEFFHRAYILKQAVAAKAADARTDNVLVIADTNLPHWYSAKEALGFVGAPETGIETETWLHHTCCLPGFALLGYDRVIANFGNSGPRMTTTLPYSRQEIYAWGARNMHLPVIGSLQY